MIDAASKAQTATDRANTIITAAQSLHNEKTERAVKIKASTLNINHLFYQECTEHMKKGLCFICHKPGHWASNHKGGRIPPSFPLSPPSNSAFRNQPKKTGASAYVAIKAAMMDLDDEEKGKALKLLEESGF